MDEEVVLPTLLFAKRMRMDCNTNSCIIGAALLIKNHSQICDEEVIVHHQRLNPSFLNKFQTIVRHGDGEAVYLKYDDISGIYFELIYKWLEIVHNYEGTHPRQ